MELERVVVAECVIPVHDDVYFVQTHGRVHVNEAILG